MPSHDGFVRCHVFAYTVPNGTGASHGAALGTATQKTITKGGSVILMTKEIFWFGFGVFPVLYNAQHKHLPSKALTCVRASQERRSPNPADPHPVRGITPLYRAPIADQDSPAGAAAVPTAACMTAAATGAPLAHPAMLQARSKRGSPGSITFIEEASMPCSSKVDEGGVVLNRTTSWVDFGMF